MTILMTADAVGGVWTYALDLMRSLAPRDVHFHLATMGEKPSREQQSQVAALPNIELHASNFRLEWMNSPWDDVARASDWLLDLAEKTSPDLVHLNGYAHANLAWNAPVLVVAHSCVLSWWRAVKGEDAPPAWDCYRERVRAGLHAADAVAAPTRAMLHEIETLYGPLPQAPDLRRAIANGREAAHFHAGEKEAFIFAAGRLWDEAKNIAALEKVASRVAWPIRVAGAAHSPQGESREYAQGETSRDAVQKLGFLSEDAMTDTLSRAAIYALPARYEPFGLSALEAALSGCALVLGDIESLREVWDDAAFFVAPDDEKQLTATLNALCSDDNLRREYSRRAQHRAQCYSLSAFAGGYESLYRTMKKGIM